MAMHESGENYLETILMLQNKNGSVRSIDIANELEYTKPSISRAMGILRKNGYITMDDGGQIPVSYTHLDVYKRQILFGQEV